MMRCCKHCGALLEDEAKVCDFCGAVLEVPQNVIPAPQEAPAVIPAPQEVTETAVQPATKKKFSKKTLFIVGGIVLAVIAIAVAVNMLFFNPSVAVDKYEAVMNGDFDKVEDLAPREYWEYIIKNRDTTVDAYIDELVERLENLKSEQSTGDYGSMGKPLSVELKVIDTEKAKAKDIAGVKTGLEKRYGIDASRVKTVYNLIIKYTRQYTEDSTVTPFSFSAVKIDSKWYLIGYYKNDGEYVVTFAAYNLTSIY